MGWRIIEGFDGLANIGELAYRSWRAVGAGASYSASGGRRGGGCIYDDVSGSTTARGHEFGGNFFRTVPNLHIGNSVAAGGGFEIGFAFKITGSGWASAAASYAYPLVELRSITNTELCRLELWNNAGTWNLRHVRGTTQLATGVFPGGGTGLPTAGRWYYVNWYVSMTEGASVVNGKTCRVYVDSSLIINNSANTQNATSSANSGYVRFFSGNGASANLPSGDAVYVDDVVMADTTTTARVATNTTVGPVRVDRVVGTEENTDFDNSFTKSAGSNEYALLNETPQDGDTTYMYSTTPATFAQGGHNHSDTTKGGLPVVPGTIYGVRAFALAKNAGAGVGIVRCDLANGASRSVGALTYSIPVAGSYEGMMSYDSVREGWSDGSSTLWVVNTLRDATSILQYVS